MLNKKKLTEAVTTHNAVLMSELLTDNDNLCHVVTEQDKSYTTLLTLFTDQSIAALTTASETAAAKRQTLRMSPTETKRVFYLLLHLIRQNNASSSSQLEFLLSLFDVHLQASQAIIEKEPNELLRLALRIGNLNALQLLMSIPTVSTLSRDAELCNITEWNWVSKQPWIETEPVSKSVTPPRSWAAALKPSSESQPPKLAAASEVYPLEKSQHLLAYTPWATWLMQAKSTQPATGMSWAARLKNKL